MAFGGTALASIFAIVDRLGVVPFFSALTVGMEPRAKRAVMSRSCLVATATLGALAVLAHCYFDAVGFSIPTFRRGEGILTLVEIT